MYLLNLNDYVRLALSHAEFSSNDDGSWTVEIPVLPGCPFSNKQVSRWRIGWSCESGHFPEHRKSPREVRMGFLHVVEVPGT